MAAVPSTTATTFISGRQNFPSSPTYSPTFSTTKSVPFPSNQRKTHQTTIRSTAGDAPPTATEAATETPIELPQGPPSLINSLNVERALRGIPITDVDHYGRLGVRFRCTNDQVFEAYKNKVDELKKKEGSITEEELNEKLELLKESFTILSSADERRFYDWSLARSRKPEDYVWPFEVDESKKSTEDPPPQEPENVAPTRYVGYAFLVWLVISIILSISFNR